jgi:membrane fusion protein
MATKLFRDEVIEAGRERLTGTVVAATPPGSRLYTWLLIAGVAILILILTFGGYATRVQVRGLVAQAGGIARIYAPAPGAVRQVHVTDGQTVAQGAPLVTVSLSQGRDPGGEGIASRLVELERQDRELARQLELAASLGSTETAGLDQQRASLAAAVASLDRQRGLLSSRIALAEADTRRAVRLAREGAGTQRQVEESRSSALALRLDLERINEQLISQRQAASSIANQIAVRRLGADRSASEIQAQRAALAEQRATLIRQDQLVLTAPVAGRIADVPARPGQRALPDTSLVTIVPRESGTEVQLYAPSRAIGFVRPGQEVRLLLDAFPYQKYGAGRGTITWISDVPTDPAALDPGLGITEPVFRIRVAIDPEGMPKAVRERQLRTGMTLSANLVLERRSLWEVFLNPVLKAIRG